MSDFDRFLRLKSQFLTSNSDYSAPERTLVADPAPSPDTVARGSADTVAPIVAAAAASVRIVQYAVAPTRRARAEGAEPGTVGTVAAEG